MGKRIFLREQVRKEEELRRQKEQREQEKTEEEVRRQNKLNREIIIEELDGGRREKESRLKYLHGQRLGETSCQVVKQCPPMNIEFYDDGQ